MFKMVVTNSCCCFGLRTGGMIIGWYGLISGIFGIVSYIQFLPYLPKYVIWLNQNVLNMTDINTTDAGEFIIEYETKSVFNYMVTSEVISILLYAALLWGIFKSNHLFLFPWLLMDGLSLVSLLFFIFIISISCFVAKLVGFGFLVLLIGSLIFVLPFYFWLVVLSLYQRIKMEKRQNLSKGNNEEIGLKMPAPIMENKPPSYGIHHEI